MPNYAVIVNGSNHLIRYEGQLRKVGYYTTRYVEANDERAAVREAIALLRADSRLKESVHNPPSDPPKIGVHGVTEQTMLDPIQPGFAWYLE